MEFLSTALERWEQQPNIRATLQGHQELPQAWLEGLQLGILMFACHYEGNLG